MKYIEKILKNIIMIVLGERIRCDSKLGKCKSKSFRKNKNKINKNDLWLTINKRIWWK